MQNRIGFLTFSFNCLKSSHALLKEVQSLPPPLELSKPQGLAELAHRVVSLYWTFAEEGSGVWAIF